MSRVIDTHFHPDSWFVMLDRDGHIYVSDPAQNYVSEFETEDEAWNYINKCREPGVDF